MEELVVEGTYAGTNMAVCELVREYRPAHPEASVERAQAAVFRAYPQLRDAYAATRAGTTRIVIHDGRGGAPASPEEPAAVWPGADALRKQSGSM